MFSFNREDLYEIPEERRALYFRILDREILINEIGPRLHYLEDHFPPNQLNDALKWLTSNNIVGPKFTSWYRVECKGSDLEMTTRLVAIVNNAPIAPLIGGKNFKL